MITVQRISELYQQGITKYGDANRDGTITMEEEVVFRLAVAKCRGILCEDFKRDARWCYPSGSGNYIPIETQLEWLKEYHPTQRMNND